MAENTLSDAKVRNATLERDGPYLSDGGGLRIRLLAPSRNHPRGAKIAEFHFKVKDDAGVFRHGAMALGTLGEPSTAADGRSRPFTLADAKSARNAARDRSSAGTSPPTSAPSRCGR
ncbi:MAG: hypothetical protein AB7P21_07725 [Lautropia sp.]